jgi:hypothetical protein
MNRMRAATFAFALAILGHLTATQSEAAEMSTSDARKLVSAQIENYQKRVVTLFPAIKLVEDAVRNDCGSKSDGKLPTSDFCTCAAVVTISLWATGADKKVAKELDDFLRNPPDEGQATEFLKYQGPELYRPLCDRVEMN